MERLDFQKWFDDSIITDTGKIGGHPLIVYHGTDNEFYRFSELHSQMYFFTESEKIAKKFSQSEIVRKYYIQMKNPFVVTFGDSWSDLPLSDILNEDDIINLLRFYNLLGKDESLENYWKNRKPIDTDKLCYWIRETKENDGVIIHDMNKVVTEYVVFHPSQIWATR